MTLTRRMVLRYGLGGATLLALGGAALGLKGGATITPPAGLRVFDARAYSVIAAITGRMLTPSPALPDPMDLEIPALVDRHVSTMHPADQKELMQGIMLIDNALVGLLLDGRPTTFTDAAPDVQDAILADWSNSTIEVRRVVFKALRGLIVAAYWGHPKLYAAAGYPGPPDYSGYQPIPAADPPSHPEEPVNDTRPAATVPG